MKTRIKLVHCDTLSCEPILRRMPDGSLPCVSQCGDLFEPASGNRVHAFRSDDDLASFRDKRVVTDFPGRYCYPDGFFENGHILFTIEINRHEILFVDCEV